MEAAQSEVVLLAPPPLDGDADTMDAAAAQLLPQRVVRARPERVFCPVYGCRGGACMRPHCCQLGRCASRALVATDEGLCCVQVGRFNGQGVSLVAAPDASAIAWQKGGHEVYAVLRRPSGVDADGIPAYCDPHK